MSLGVMPPTFGSPDRLSQPWKHSSRPEARVSRPSSQWPLRRRRHPPRARHRREYRDLHASRSGCAEEVARQGSGAAGDALPGRGEHGQQRRHPHACLSALPGSATARRAVIGSHVPPPGRRLDQRRQRHRARARRHGIGKLLLDVGRKAGGRPSVQLERRRPGLPGTSRRRSDLRLLGQPLLSRPQRRRQEDPGERSPLHDRRRFGARIHRHRSGAGAAPVCPDPDEAGDVARLAVAQIADRRSRWVQVFGRLKPGYTVQTARGPIQGSSPRSGNTR